jgi:hypothetical protein
MNYGQAVRVIAFEENSTDLNFESISDYPSVYILSQTFKTSIETIVEDIIRIRSFTREMGIRHFKQKKMSQNKKNMIA